MKLRSIRLSPRRAFALAALMAGSALAAPAISQECEIKLGTVGPMTGGGASWGLSERAGMEFEAAWQNANGGVSVGGRKCKVRIVAVDGQSTVAGGAAASNYLASQGVYAINGPVLSAESAGFKPVSKRHGQVNFATSFAKDIIGPDFPLAFHKVQGPVAWGGIVIKAARDLFQLKSAVVVGPNDQSGTDSGVVLAQIYNDLGVKTGTEWYQRGTTNFGPIATRIMGMNVDAVDLTTLPPGDAALVAKDLRNAGYEGAFGRLGAGGDVVINNSGGVAGQKAFYWFDHIPTEDPAIKKLSSEFEELMKTKVPDNALVFNAQLVAENLLRVISVVGSDQDGEKIAAELRRSTPDSRYLGKHGWRGKGQYGINQEFSFPVGFNYIKDGKVGAQLKLEIPAEN